MRSQRCAECRQYIDDGLATQCAAPPQRRRPHRPTADSMGGAVPPRGAVGPVGATHSTYPAWHSRARLALLVELDARPVAEVYNRAMDPIAVLRKAVDQTGRIVGGVKSDQLSGSTPCTEWDTRALLNHTIGAVEMFDDAAQTKPFTGAMFASDNVGDDPGASYERRAAALHTTLAEPNVLDRTWTMPFGEVPGSVGVGFATLELFQHGWDVARASGQQIDFDADVTEVANATAQMAPAEQVRVPGVFGPEAICPPGAAAADRLAAFMGRLV